MACQYSGKKWILHENTPVFWCLIRYVVLNLVEFVGKLLKSRCNYVIIEFELYRLSQKKSGNVQKCRLQSKWEI